ncbi:MAG: energy transducer TonB [Planctomycetota bacterium]
MGNKGFPLIVAFSVALHAVVLYGWTVSTFEPPVLDMLAGKMSVALAFELVPVEEPVEVVEEPVEEPVEVVEEPVEEPVEVVEKPVKAVVKVAEPVEIKPAAASVPSIGISTDPSPLEDLNKPPLYPSKLGRRLHGETVLLEVQVLVDGSVGEIRMEKSSRYSLANKAVLKAVRKWQYRPAKRDGVAVEALHQERIVFEYRPGRSGSFGRD